MRFIFKTTYRQDLRLFRDHFQRNWYLALVAGLLVLPILLPDYLVDFSLVLIFGLCALSLMVLAGYTGLVSLGHAAFLGIGAYAHVYFSQDLGLPWIVSVALAAGIAAAAGVLVGLPALRMTGIYLTIATLAFALIIQEVFNHWDSVTGGLRGKAVEKPVIFGVPLRGDAEFYFLCLAFLAAGLWITRNVLRAPTGRAWVAIRDSEIAAQSMGINLAVYKTMAFAYSAAMMGLAGALFAHKIGFLAPDIFTVLLSIQFLLMVVVGGLGSLHGAIFGAICVALLPVLISEARDRVPDWFGQLFGIFGTHIGLDVAAAVDRFVKQPGLEPGIFGLILVLFILFEPQGIYGRWVKRHQSSRRCQFHGRAGRGFHDHRPKRRRQDHDLQPRQPDLRSDRWASDLFGRGDHTVAAA
jgi:branched-chain amino acid transport system permease protein